MEMYFLWGSVGIMFIFLLIGFLAGIIRGLKRASLHSLFLLVSIVVSFFITRPITDAILNASVTFNGDPMPLGQFLVNMVLGENAETYKTAAGFLEKVPSALASPVLFIFITILVFLIFDIIYLIVARISFGTKRRDFKENGNKPRRWLGSLVGVVEGLVFMFILFAPLTALTKTFEEITYIPTTEIRANDVEDGDEEEPFHMPKLAEMLNEFMPSFITEIVSSYNNSVIGVVSGAGGLDKALFDGLSTIKFEGEKINLRKDLMNLVDTYNNVADVANAYSDGRYDDISLGALKKNITTIVDSGIFKTLVIGTAEEYLASGDLSAIGLPEMGVEILSVIKDKLNDVDFKLYDYIREDIVKLVNAVDRVFEKVDIEKDGEENKQTTLFKDAFTFLNEEGTGIKDALTIVKRHVGTIENIVKDLFTLNVLEDAFKPVVNYASEELTKMFEERNEEELYVGLNTEVKSISTTLEQLIVIFEKALGTVDEVDVDLIIDGEYAQAFEKITNLDEVLATVGEILDDVRGLELLVVEEEEDTVYVLDNIMKLFGFEVLGDVVYEYETNEEGEGVVNKVTLDSYSAFIGHISPAIVNVQKMKLLSAILPGAMEEDEGIQATDETPEEESSMFEFNLDDIIEGITSQLEGENANIYILSETLLPFKYLTFMNLNEMVYGQVVDMLKSSTTQFLTFEHLTAADEAIEGETEEDKIEEKTKESFKLWWEELGSLGNILKSLNTVGVGQKTYLKFIFSEEFASSKTGFDDLIEALVNDEVNFETIIDSFFAYEITSPIANTVLGTINEAFTSLTTLNTEITIEQYKADENASSTLQKLLKKILEMNKADEVVAKVDEETATSIRLEDIGYILDVLKANAATEKGAFKQAFINLIWYMTEDDAFFNGTEAGGTAFEEHAKVKAYLDSVMGEGDYYSINYQEAFKKIDLVADIAQDILSALDALEDAETLEEAMDVIKDVLDGFKTDENGKTVDVADVLDSFAEFIEDQADSLKDALAEFAEDGTLDGLGDIIDDVFAEDSALAEALKNLFGLGESADGYSLAA